jgi:hypothetical protein
MSERSIAVEGDSKQRLHSKPRKYAWVAWSIVFYMVMVP